MIERLDLHNFKSARDLQVTLSSLTVLAGLNGSGKSTILQALALLRQSLRPGQIAQELSLRGALVQLGRSEDVRFEDAKDDEIGFVVKTAKGETRLSAPTVSGADTLPLRCDGDVDDVAAELAAGFQFIQADRITPATQYQQASTADQASGWLGCSGQFTIDYLLRNETEKVSAGRLFSGDGSNLPANLLKQVAPTEGLLDQTSAWMQHLSPGVRARAFAVELADATALRFSYTGTSVESNSRDHRPSNVGFGLTYCLPIVVACLSAPKGALLLLENPEAHLHPRGQSALGQLLARSAADGVQIIVETHSDHVLNGIRVAAKRAEIANDSVAVHFFSRDVESGESSIASPVLHANGRFSDWPEGFFDEWSKALDELLDT
jgi:predicted ATPase